METANANINSREDGYIHLGGKSWTAYAISIFAGLFIALIAHSIGKAFSPFLGYAFLIISIAWIVYRLLELKSYSLHADQNGIWIYSGILPWNKGIRGVKWRDLDEALYFPTLISWLFRSYTIRIGHRFTKSSEIVLSHWASGDKVAVLINEQHAELVQNKQIH